MGGRAFLTAIPGASFPRMAPEIYHSFKAQHFAELKKMFRLVGVPREAPGKETHGDIDFVVCSPLEPGRVRAEDIKSALGAAKYIVENHAVNLAIPMGNVPGEFYQVDVNDCQDEEEWRRIMFFQSYGDLGMILGVVARHNGLTLGLHGLKIPHSGEMSMAPFLLSADYGRIMQFFGLDLAAWEAGFASKEAVFEWVASSRLFYVGEFKESARRLQRRDGRKMYQNFLVWAAARGGKERGEGNVVEEAKEFFGQTRAYEEGVEKERRRRKVKEMLNGRVVMEWTGLYGLAVREVMEGVRARVDEDQISRMSREEMRVTVLGVQKSMTSK